MLNKILIVSVLIIFCKNGVESQKIHEKSVRPHGPVNSTCLAYLKTSDKMIDHCEFMKCFEKRYIFNE